MATKKRAALAGLQDGVIDPGGGTMERSYAAPRADGSPNPTMNTMNPQWAQWFDRAGGNPVFANQGGARNLPDAQGDFTAQTSDLGEVRGSNMTQPQFQQGLQSIRSKPSLQALLGLLGQ